MLTFSKRVELCIMYRAYLNINKEISDSPEGFLAFLQSRSLLNEENIEDYLNEYFPVIEKV